MSRHVVMHALLATAAEFICAVGVGAQAIGPAPGAHTGHPAVARTDTAVSHFIAEARAATGRYIDPAVAVRDGFQPMGRETPGMGQHWVNAGRLFRGEFSAGQPAGLQYATIDGALTLVGVTYILPLLADERPPGFPGVESWHTHAGTIDEETLVPDHDAAARATGPRVSVLHAWIWTNNPAGVFASDNWSLPFARLGLATPSSDAAATGRALSLASGASAHFTSIIQRHGQPSSGDSAAIRTAVDAATAEVRGVVSSTPRAALSREDIVALERIWIRLWRRIDNSVAPDVRERLRPLMASFQRKEPTQ